MPLYKIAWTKQQNGWAVWHVTETAEALAAMVSPEVCPENITSAIKRIEWCAGRLLFRHMLSVSKIHYEGVIKDEFGKPFLINKIHHVSLSHSYPYVAAQISARRPVGIDIEQPKEKLLKVAHRVFSKTELLDAGNDIVKNCVYWCAKESLYKIYSKKSLSFIEHLHVDPFHLSAEGVLNGRIALQGDAPVALRYRVEKDFVMVITEDV